MDCISICKSIGLKLGETQKCNLRCKYTVCLKGIWVSVFLADSFQTINRKNNETASEWGRDTIPNRRRVFLTAAKPQKVSLKRKRYFKHLYRWMDQFHRLLGLAFKTFLDLKSVTVTYGFLFRRNKAHSPRYIIQNPKKELKNRDRFIS